MSEKIKVVEKYLESYERLDYEDIKSTLSPDVEWIAPGLFHVHGVKAFMEEAARTELTGIPEITTNRLLESNDVVIAEGIVVIKSKSEEVVKISFCDLFEIENAKIKKLISYLMQIPT